MRKKTAKKYALYLVSACFLSMEPHSGVHAMEAFSKETFKKSSKVMHKLILPKLKVNIKVFRRNYSNHPNIKFDNFKKLYYFNIEPDKYTNTPIKVIESGKSITKTEVRKYNKIQRAKLQENTESTSNISSYKMPKYEKK